MNRGEIIDIHSHIIPNIDDGSKNIEMTLEMIEASINDGVVHIVATPHYRTGLCDVSYLEVKEKAMALNETLKNMGANITVHYGQEVYFNRKLLENFEEKIIGTIDNSRYMLIELSSRKLDDKIFDTLYELKLKGIVPIIVHPERYLYIQRQPELINNLIDEGCLFQLNAGSIVGRYGEKAKGTAIKLLKSKIYSFIGSDSHNNVERRTCITEGLDKIFTIDKDFKNRAIENSKKILENKEIYFKEKIEKSGIFSFLKKRR